MQCGNEVPIGRMDKGKHAKFCSRECCALFSKEKYRERTGRSGWADISRGKSGAVSELVVSADLLTRGYEVFRAVAQDGSCDIVVLKDGSILRIEIRSGYKTDDGTVKATANKLNPSKYDVLAIVTAGRDITYVPDITAIVP